MDPLQKALEKHRTSQNAVKGEVRAARERHKLDLPASSKNGTDTDLIDAARSIQQVSEAHLEAQRLVGGLIRSKYADVYRMLRVQVLQKMRQQNARSLAICSAKSGDGKTLTAANLALSLALEPNQSVLLVDLDLRRPRLHTAFGVKVELGLCDYLEGKAEIEDCTINLGIERLALVPVRRQLLNSSELLSSQRMSDLLLKVQAGPSGRIVVFDLPPLLASDDAMVVLPKIDASLLVVREGQTQVGEIQRCTKLLEAHNLIGSLLNESREDNPYPYY